MALKTKEAMTTTEEQATETVSVNPVDLLESLETPDDFNDILGETVEAEIDYSDQAEFDDLDWKKLKPSSVANMMPWMNDEELSQLADDIVLNGQLEEIILTKEKVKGKEKVVIFDGRNRHRACVLKNIRPRFRWVKEGKDTFNVMVGLNIRRRQLTGSQRGCIGANIFDTVAEFVKSGAVDWEGDVRDFVGRIAGCTGRYVSSAITIKEKAPDLFEQCAEGTMTLSQALVTIKDRAETESRDADGNNQTRGGGVEPTLEATSDEDVDTLYDRALQSGTKVVSRRQLLSLLREVKWYRAKYGPAHAEAFGGDSSEDPQIGEVVE